MRLTAVALSWSYSESRSCQPCSWPGIQPSSFFSNWCVNNRLSMVSEGASQSNPAHFCSLWLLVLTLVSEGCLRLCWNSYLAWHSLEPALCPLEALLFILLWVTPATICCSHSHPFCIWIWFHSPLSHSPYHLTNWALSPHQFQNVSWEKVDFKMSLSVLPLPL